MSFSRRCLNLSAYLLGADGGQNNKLVPAVSLSQLDRCLNYSEYRYAARRILLLKLMAIYDGDYNLVQRAAIRNVCQQAISRN